MPLRYLSDLQAKLARLERSADNTSGAAEDRRAENEVPIYPDTRDSSEGGDPPQVENQSTPGGTRESTPNSRQDPEGANLVNPLIESPSKFMASSCGKTCELLLLSSRSDLT